MDKVEVSTMYGTMSVKTRLLFLKHALDNVLEEYKEASLNELERIANSSNVINDEEALEKLKNIYDLYLGKSLGVRYMFNLMTDTKTLNEIETDLHHLKDSFRCDLNIMYCTFIMRLDKIYTI